MNMQNQFPLAITESHPKSFTLIELIIVIIIVGILAAVGISQYSLVVEKGRTTEAKERIGTMRQLAYQYYLEHGSLTGLTNADLGVDYTCHSTDFYKYNASDLTSTMVDLLASRCTSGSGGKTPDSSWGYYYYLRYFPATGQSTWYCEKVADGSHCFGL